MRILTRGDTLQGEPLLPDFRLPLLAFFDDVSVTDPYSVMDYAPSSLVGESWDGGGGSIMDFYAVLDQILALLRQRQRVTYRALKLQLQWMMRP